MAFAIPWARMEEIVEGLRGTHNGRHPLPDHPVHGVRGQAAAALHGGEPALGRRDGQGRAHEPRPRGGRLQALLRRPRAGLPDRRLVRRHAGRAVSIEEYCTNPTKAIKAMMNYYERYQPDVVLAYNDLAKEAEAFGCRRQVLRLRRARRSRRTCSEDKARPRASSGCPIPTRRARLPGFLEQCEALVKAAPPDGHRRGRGRAVDDRDAAAQPRDDAARHLRGPAVHPRPDAVRPPTTASSGATRSSKTKIGLSLLRAHRLHQPDLARTTTGSSSRPTTRSWWTTSRPRRSGVTDAHLRHHLPDLRGPDRLRLHDDLLRPRPAGRSRSSTWTSSRASWRSPRGARSAIGNVDATKFEKATQAEMEAEVRRCIDTAARHSGFILSTSCEIPPRSNPEIVQVVHGRGPRLRPLRADPARRGAGKHEGRGE